MSRVVDVCVESAQAAAAMSDLPIPALGKDAAVSVEVALPSGAPRTDTELFHEHLDEVLE
jgi:hypothetical protein